MTPRLKPVADALERQAIRLGEIIAWHFQARRVRAGARQLSEDVRAARTARANATVQR